MPLTRPITAEEDITMSLSTTITGLVTKYNGKINAKEVLASIFANTAIGINELIQGSNMTITEKASLRGDIKTICARAMRAPLNLVTPDGRAVANSAPADVEGDALIEKENPNEG